MSFRHLAKTAAVSGALSIAIALSAPAFAEVGPGELPALPGLPSAGQMSGMDTRPVWKEAAQQALPRAPYSAPAAYSSPSYASNYGVDPQARENWLNECRRRRHDNGLGGAAIGGFLGGLFGNRIAGRGNRTVGTIAGAAGGAVLGAVIDKNEDRGRSRDECEAYLDNYYAQYAAQEQHYRQYQQQYQQRMVMVPARAQPECVENVTYEDVDVPVRTRYIAPRRTYRAVPDKRIRVVPDKRVRVY